MYFDTHVHFDLIKSEGGPEGVIARALAAGVTRMVAVGGNEQANAFAMSLAAKFPNSIRAAIGYDRDRAMEHCPMDQLEAMLIGPAVDTSHIANSRIGMIRSAAIGEIGLDFHYHPETSAEQQALFAAQLSIARRLRLPVIVHNREADGPMLELLREHSLAWSSGGGGIGVLHCFTGNVAMARSILDLGFCISFSGIVTFRNAESLRDVAGFVPADRILIETDTPLLAPVPLRGQPNEPANLPLVAKVVAGCRGCRVEEIAELTSCNAGKLFGMSTS